MPKIKARPMAQGDRKGDQNPGERKRGMKERNGKMQNQRE
jgi:hypothetical protein